MRRSEGNVRKIADCEFLRDSIWRGEIRLLRSHVVNAIGQGFRASLFHPDLGNQAVNGKIFLDRSSLRFTSETLTHEIPAARLEADWEAADGRITFRDSGDPELNVFTLEHAVVIGCSMPQIVDLRAQMEAAKSRSEFFRRLRLTGYFVLIAGLAAWAISWISGRMVRSIAARVPPAWEQQLGETSIDSLRKSTSLVENSNWLAEIHLLAEPLLKVIPNGGKQIQFFIADSRQLNAFALPGGFVVVNRGLLEIIDRPEELQGVLAHELAHVTEKHLVRKLVAASGPVLIFGLFFHSNSGLMNALSEGSGIIVVQGFSKEFETEADEVGWNYLVKANIDPRGMITMFQKFKAEEKLMPLKMPEAFSSHPLLDKRIARLEKKWTKLSRKDFLNQTNLQPALIFRNGESGGK